LNHLLTSHQYIRFKKLITVRFYCIGSFSFSDSRYRNVNISHNTLFNVEKKRYERQQRRKNGSVHRWRILSGHIVIFLRIDCSCIRCTHNRSGNTKIPRVYNAYDDFSMKISRQIRTNRKTRAGMCVSSLDGTWMFSRKVSVEEN